MTETWHDQVRAKNRDDLTAAGKSLFLKHGFLQANVKDICDAAGISRVTFYKHFDSLDHIIFEIQMELLESMTAYVTQPAPGHFNGKQELAFMLKAWFRYTGEHPDYIRFIVMFNLHYETYEADSEARQRYELFIEVKKQKHFLLPTLDKGIKDGSLKPDLYPLETAHFIFTSMMGVLQNRSIRYAAHQEDEHIRLMERFIHMLVDYVSSGD